MGTAPLPDELRTPHPARLPPSTPGYDAILAAHEEAILEHEPGYVDPETLLEDSLGTIREYHDRGNVRQHEYSEDDDAAHIEALLPALCDSRALIEFNSTSRRKAWTVCR